jgi:hypothetical protein
MARARTHSSWINCIRIELANNPGISGAEIRRKLRNRQIIKKEDTPTTQVPSDRAIRRIMADFKKAPESQQQSYRSFAWPESMEIGALPWEASRAVLDLMRLRSENNMVRPLVVEAQWFWRVTQAMPDTPIEQRARWAIHLTLIEKSESDKTKAVEDLQWQLAYQMWRSPEDANGYQQAIKEGRIPEPQNIPLKIGIDDLMDEIGHHFETPTAKITTIGSVFKNQQKADS